MKNHPAKIRIQNQIGRICFKQGISFSDEAGVRFQMQANDWITRIFFLSGNYEAKSVELAKHIMADGGMMLDVGANFGLFSCQVAGNIPGAFVYAIEPNIKILPALLNNLSINNLQKKVKVVQAAASAGFNLVGLIQPASNNVGTTAVAEGNEGDLLVPGIPLSFLLEQEKVKAVKLIKIDVEGYEFEVIKKFPFSEFLVEHIILEFNSLGQLTLAEWMNFMGERGFEAFDVFGNPLDITIQEVPEHNIWFKNVKATLSS